ncbi:MAG: alpha/beta hydrolase [Oscillospiraceae bacterium]|nr:alpha/beta hydrolase [Oscillospiraceae bacterium]
MLKTKNGCLYLPAGEMDYIRFGTGERTLVLLPGVGDGLKTVKGMALPFALLYRALTGDFTVYGFSRRRELPEHMTTREMAEDLNAAMEALGLDRAAVVGVSQGGMIAQWLAIDHPDKVGRLVLTVTLARPNPVVKDVIERWSEMARRGDYRGIMLDTAERSYSPRRLKAARMEYKLLGSLGKPKSFGRFLTQAESCLTHDAFDRLGKIACPTLVIGGREDRIVTGAASEELAERIPNSELYMYDGLGHGLYEEAPDWLERVAAFCRGERENHG